MIRILIVGIDHPTAIERRYFRALSCLRDVEVSFFATHTSYESSVGARILRRIGFDIESSLIFSSLSNWLLVQPKFDLILIVKGQAFTSDQLRSIKTHYKGSVIACLNPDDPFNTANSGASSPRILGSIDAYDYYITWSQRISDLLQARGVKNVIQMPFAVEPIVDDMARVPISQRIAFVGTYDTDRERFITEADTSEIDIYGDRWQRSSSGFKGQFFIKPIHLNSSQMAFVYQSHLMSLNILRDQNEGATNMRTFEVCGWGGLLLTKFTVDQEKIFPHGVASITYRQPSDIRQIFKDTLAGLYDTQQIRRNALEISREHTYVIRSTQLLETIFNRKFHIIGSNSQQ